MKFLILPILIFSLSARAQYQGPSSCPYEISDTASRDELKNIGSVLSQELANIKDQMTREKESCLLPPINEVAKAEQLIKALATKVVPAQKSFAALTLAGQEMKCTTSVSGLKDIVSSYKEFILDNFDSLPDQSSLQKYMTFNGPDGDKINDAFFTCQQDQNGTSKELKVFNDCIDDKLFGNVPNSKNAVINQIWETNCSKNFAESSQVIQDILNESEIAKNKRETTEALMNSAYKQISGTIDSLLKTDPNCKVSSQVANIGNSLISAAVGIGQQLGSPWVGLGLNLVAKPISTLINRIAQSTERQYVKELEGFFKTGEKERNNKILCSTLAMQKLKCETFEDYKNKNLPENCSPMQGNINNKANFKDLVTIVNTVGSIDQSSSPLANAIITENNAVSYLNENMADSLSELDELFFKPINGLASVENFDREVSLFEYLFATGKGVMSKVNPEKMPRLADKIRFKKEQHNMAVLENKLKEFHWKVGELSKNNLDPKMVAGVLNDYKLLASMLSNTGPKTNTNTPASYNQPVNYNQPGDYSNSYQNGVNQNQLNTTNVPVNGTGMNNGIVPHGMNPPQNAQSQMNYGAPIMIPAHQPYGGAVNLPFVLGQYFSQMAQEGKSVVFKYALNEMDAITRMGTEKTHDNATRGLMTADRFSNTETYFNFMNKTYIQDNVLHPKVASINVTTDKPVPIKDRELYFDVNILPALRDCLFLYQPIVMANKLENNSDARKINEEYKKRCDFAFKCQDNLGFNLDMNPNENLNNTTNADAYKPICHIQKNFGFIFSKARQNFLKTGNTCGN